MPDKKIATGFLNEGDDTTLMGCTFEGFDRGVHNKGKRMKAIKNIFRLGKKEWYQSWWGQLILILISAGIIYWLGWN